MPKTGALRTLTGHIQRKAKREAEKVMKIVGPLRQAGQTPAAIADVITDMGVAT